MAYEVVFFLKKSMNKVCGLQGMPFRIHSIQKVRQGEKQRIYNNKNENYQRFIAKETDKN